MKGGGGDPCLDGLTGTDNVKSSCLLVLILTLFQLITNNHQLLLEGAALL